MKKLTLLLVIMVAGVAGCQTERFRSQPLGEVGYAEAFRSGKRVMSQYFSIASADAETGRIVSRPKAVEAARDRLLGTTPARKIANMRIRQKGDLVFVDIRVDVQRRDVVALRQMQPITVDSELPHQTPADESAAVGSEQSRDWQTTARDHQLEHTILADLLKAIKQSK